MLQAVLRHYVEHRITLVANSADTAGFQRGLEEVGPMHDQMTALVGEAVDGGTPVVVPLVNTLNEVTSSHAFLPPHRSRCLTLRPLTMTLLRTASISRPTPTTLASELPKPHRVVVAERHEHRRRAAMDSDRSGLTKASRLASYVGRFVVVALPNITNIFYGRDAGYDIERIVLDDPAVMVGTLRCDLDG